VILHDIGAFKDPSGSLPTASFRQALGGDSLKSDLDPST
jgi:hypothetical protein